MSTPVLPPAPTPPPISMEIAAFVRQNYVPSPLALQTASHALLDTLATAMPALAQAACAAWLGPLVPNTNVPLGARVPGTDLELDPATAAGNLALCCSWLRLDPAWLGVRPVFIGADLAPLLAVSDWLSRNADRPGPLWLLGATIPRPHPIVTMRELLTHWVMAVEIHGRLARERAERETPSSPALAAGAMAAVTAHLLGGGAEHVQAAFALALAAEEAPAPTAPSAALASADAASRAVVAAARALAGPPRPWIRPGLHLAEPLGSVIMEQALFNIAYPDALSAQTALEVAVHLHPQVRHRMADIERVDVSTHAAALDRYPSGGEATNGDRPLAAAVSVGLLYGRAEAEHFTPAGLADPRLAALSAKIVVQVDERFTADYADPDKQALANAVQVCFRDGSRTERLSLEYPVGHYRRRTEGIPLLFGKAETHLRTRFGDAQVDEIIDGFDHPEALGDLPVDQFVDRWLG